MAFLSIFATIIRNTIVMKIKSLFLSFVLLLVTTTAGMAQSPKREFRGAWIQCVNGQFQGLSKETMQKTLASQLDALQQA